jgi:3-deoxy-D-manno-octulosonic-acid transferase
MAGAARELFAGFDLVLPQDEEAARRLSGLGARDDGRLNLKLAGDPLPVDDAALAMIRRQLGEGPVLLAASTHPGEEEMALEAFQGLNSDRPDWAARLVIVPRHPVRGGEIAARAEEMGFPTYLRSRGDADAAEVWVADTLGELGLWFRLAASAFVGGSLVPGVGGHNPLEPARLDCPILAGPHTTSWAAVYRALDEAGGVRRVADPEALDRGWRADIEDARQARTRARRARTVAEAGGEALDRAAERLLGLIR